MSALALIPTPATAICLESRPVGEENTKYALNPLVPTKWCTVSYQSQDRIEHNVVLEAESVYEAVAAEVAAFRRQKFLELEPGPNTEFTIEVTPEPAMQHRIRFGQVQQWRSIRSPRVRQIFSGERRSGIYWPEKSKLQREA